MGRNKHCSAELRSIVQGLREEGKSLRAIAKIISCSLGMVVNALKEKKNGETRGRKRKTSSHTDLRIVRCAKKNPFITSAEIKTDLNLQVDSSLIRRRLIENNLKACHPKKCPLLSKKNIKDRLNFAERHLQKPAEKWRNILWSDETKINLFGPDTTNQYVRRPAGKEFDPKYTVKTVKHGGGNIMVWGCFTYYGVGPIHWIQETLTKEKYIEILNTFMYPFAEDNLPLLWLFQQDNDPKHTAKVTKKWFSEKKVQLLEWPAQSPDLNPIENLWGHLKRELSKASKPKNKLELWENVKKIWYEIPPNLCQKLVDSMPRRCGAVLASKGSTTKY